MDSAIFLQKGGRFFRQEGWERKEDMTKYFWAIPIYLICSRSGRRLLLAVLFLLSAVYLVYRYESAGYRLSPIQERVGEELVDRAVEQFPWSADGVGRVRLISEDDHWEYFQDAIRLKVADFDSSGGRKFDILPDNFFIQAGRFFSRLAGALGFSSSGKRLSPEKIDSIRRKMDADALLLVRFDRNDYQEDETNATGRLTCTFYSKENLPPKVVTAGVICQKSGQILNRIDSFSRSKSFAMRLLWAVLAVVLFPFLVAPITLSVIKKQSSRLTACLMIIYILALFVFEWVMWGTPVTLAQSVWLCVWGVAIIWYLLKVSNYLASYYSNR